MAELILTKYEMARIIGARALQLAFGAPPLVKPEPGASFIEVAKLELENGVIPLHPIRKMAAES
ncbi:MAG: DNA-directed RNA polymerase subunit K [Candidatus Anstonellales archaeon]